MKALILNNKVVQVEEQTFPVAPDLIWIDCPDNCERGWLYNNGELSAPPVNELNAEEKLEQELPGTDIKLNAIWKYIRDADKTEFDKIESDIQSLYNKYGISRN